MTSGAHSKESLTPSGPSQRLQRSLQNSQAERPLLGAHVLTVCLHSIMVQVLKQNTSACVTGSAQQIYIATRSSHACIAYSSSAPLNAAQESL